MNFLSQPQGVTSPPSGNWREQYPVAVRHRLIEELFDVIQRNFIQRFLDPEEKKKLMASIHKFEEEAFQRADTRDHYAQMVRSKLNILKEKQGQVRASFIQEPAPVIRINSTPIGIVKGSEIIDTYTPKTGATAPANLWREKAANGAQPQSLGSQPEFSLSNLPPISSEWSPETKRKLGVQQEETVLSNDNRTGPIENQKYNSSDNNSGAQNGSQEPVIKISKDLDVGTRISFLSGEDMKSQIESSVNQILIRQSGSFAPLIILDDDDQEGADSARQVPSFHDFTKSKPTSKVPSSNESPWNHVGTKMEHKSPFNITRSADQEPIVFQDSRKPQQGLTTLPSPHASDPNSFPVEPVSKQNNSHYTTGEALLKNSRLELYSTGEDLLNHNNNNNNINNNNSNNHHNMLRNKRPEQYSTGSELLLKPSSESSNVYITGDDLVRRSNANPSRSNANLYTTGNALLRNKRPEQYSTGSELLLKPSSERSNVYITGDDLVRRSNANPSSASKESHYTTLLPKPESSYTTLPPKKYQNSSSQQNTYSQLKNSSPQPTVGEAFEIINGRAYFRPQSTSIQPTKPAATTQSTKPAAAVKSGVGSSQEKQYAQIPKTLTSDKKNNQGQPQDNTYVSLGPKPATYTSSSQRQAKNNSKYTQGSSKLKIPQSSSAHAPQSPDSFGESPPSESTWRSGTSPRPQPWSSESRRGVFATQRSFVADLQEPPQLAVDEYAIAFEYSEAEKPIVLACKKTSSVLACKQRLWKYICEKARIEKSHSPLPLELYIFVVDGDDFLFDETIYLRDTPYLHFCAKAAVQPRFKLERYALYKKSLVQIGAAIGTPLCWTNDQGEADHFRKKMTRLRYNKYHTPAVRTNAIAEVLRSFPREFQVRMAVNIDINKTIACTPSTTVGDLLRSALNIYDQFFNTTKQATDHSGWVLKFRGYEEYIFEEHRALISYETVYNFLRNGNRIELALIRLQSLPFQLLQQVNDVRSAARFKQLPLGQDFTETARAMNEVSLKPTSTHKFKIRFPRALSNIECLQLESHGFKPQSKPVKIYTTVGLYYIREIITLKTEDFMYHGGNLPVWSKLLEGPQLVDLPAGTLIHIVIWAQTVGKKAVPLGWVNVPLTDWRGCLRQGSFSLPLDRGTPNPLSLYTLSKRSPTDNALLKQARLGVEFPLHSEGVLYYPADLPEAKKEPMKVFSSSIPSEEEQLQLQAIIHSDPLYVPSEEDRKLLWKHRNYCSTIPHSLTKWVWAIPVNDRAELVEAHSLLDRWPLFDTPSHALELLKPRFMDPKIKQFTIKNLQRLSDNELVDYLPQLVQSLKHEMHHNSPLARFLLQRAIQNRQQIGHFMFWYLRAECHIPESWERFSLMLEVYMRCCGSFREELLKQADLTNQMTRVAQSIVKCPDKKLRHSILSENLSKVCSFLTNWQSFQIPISSTHTAKALLPEKCKFMQSKTVPLWLVFDNVDPLGDPHYVICKTGDDLRQDALTLQMIRIMDKLWLQNNLDLKMVHYTVMATGQDQGWIQVVQKAKTMAQLQKEYGGVSSIFDVQTLSKYLKQHNPTPLEIKKVTDTFIRSCAGSCVATYVLGIGDRHNDNVMLTEDGHLFHIDFGRFLGNAETFAGIRRDRAPFVFTPDMAYVMGGTDSAQFKFFVECCSKAYNVLRKHASVFINIFGMMVSTGIPELSSEDDLVYLREAFSLGLSDEEAAAKFSKLITEALNTKAVQVNYLVHLLANPK